MVNRQYEFYHLSVQSYETVHLPGKKSRVGMVAELGET